VAKIEEGRGGWWNLGEHEDIAACLYVSSEEYIFCILISFDSDFYDSATQLNKESLFKDGKIKSNIFIA
jgi:hypothetical protein